MEKEYKYKYAIVLKDNCKGNNKCWIKTNAEGYYSDEHYSLFAVSGVSERMFERMMELGTNKDIDMVQIIKYLGDYSAMDTLNDYIYERMCS